MTEHDPRRAHKTRSSGEFRGSLKNWSALDTRSSHKAPEALDNSPGVSLASPAAPVLAQPTCCFQAKPHIQKCTGKCSQTAGVQKPQAGHPWRRDTLASFKQTGPTPGSTAVIRRIKIPRAAVQLG